MTSPAVSLKGFQKAPALPILLLIAALALGWWSVSTGIAASLASERPGAALDFNSRNVEALVGRATVLLRQNKTDEADVLVRRALKLEPLNIDALTAAAALASAQNDERRATQLMLFNAERTWRDRDVQLWVMQYALSRRDYVTAYSQADALLRRASGSGAAVINNILLTLDGPEAVGAIVKRLELRPVWRGSFLISLGAQAPIETATAVMRRLGDSSTPPTSRELGPFLDHIARERGAHGAYLAWREVSPSAPADAHTIVNGDFEEKDAAPPFDWTFGQAAGLGVDLAPAPEGPGSSLRVEYDGYSAAPKIASQMLGVAPGAYELRGAVFGTLPAREPVLLWQVNCTRPTRTLASAPVAVSGESWTRFGLRFSMPADCQAAEVALVGRAGDRRTSSLIFVDNLALVPVAVAQAEVEQP